MEAAQLPERVATLDDLARVEAAATRLETPCGDGRMVWHSWGAGAPVVLVHGGSGGWAHWARNIRALVDQGRKVYACDLPGCGESDRPPVGEDGDALPPWIEKGVTALGLDAFDLVGFSFGAMVSGFYAARYPQRVRKLVLVGPPALSEKPGARIALKEWLRLPDGPQREDAFRHNLRLLMLANDASVDSLSLGLYVRCLKQDRLTKRRIARTDVLLRSMPDISAPVYATWGAEDVLARGRFDVLEAGLRRAKNFREMKLIPHAGHWAQFEAPDAFDAMLRQWLAA
ncbi:MAG: alpha/beta hydrolase [Rhodoblastus sp.]